MGLIQSSPWADAGNYGAGLGQTLGQALTQMPMQRNQMLMQMAQLVGNQRHEAAQMQFQQEQAKQAQMAQQAQQAMQMQELEAKKQEYANAEIDRQKRYELAKKEIDLAHRKAVDMSIDPKFDKETGQYLGYGKVNDDGSYNWVPAPQATEGLGGMPQRPPARFVPPTGGQWLDSYMKGSGQIAKANEMGWNTNNPVAYKDLTNSILPIVQAARQHLLGLGMPQQHIPFAGPVQPQGGQFTAPQTNNPPQLGLPPQQAGATNRVGRFIVEPL